MKRIAVLLALVAFHANSAQACSPRQGWRPPTAAEAYQNAGVVVYGVVESVRGDPMHPIAKLKNVIVLKGAELPDHEVRTTSGATCGIGGFQVGREYVFFLRNASDSVSVFSQPGRDAGAILEELKAAGLVAK